MESGLEDKFLDRIISNLEQLPPPIREHYAKEIEQAAQQTTAPIMMARAVVPHMLRARQGRIITVTTSLGTMVRAGYLLYGSSKAALEQLSAILAAENPNWRVYWVDPGDMRTQMHQDAYPGEDISDRPLPEISVPGFLTLLEGRLPSGRYQARRISELANSASSLEES